MDDFNVGSIIKSTGIGAIAVVGMDGAEVSTFGGLSTSAAVSSGIAGIVIDGGCRDLDEIRSSGLFVASRHLTPRSGKRRVKVVEIGGVVQCGGVTVSPGDLVIADDTGIVVVRAARVLEALSLAEQLSGNDRAFARELGGGAEFGTVATRLRHL